MEENRFCTRCGRRRQLDHLFCAGCGRKLDDDAEHFILEPVEEFSDEELSDEVLSKEEPVSQAEATSNPARLPVPWGISLALAVAIAAFILGDTVLSNPPAREAWRALVPTDVRAAAVAGYSAIFPPPDTPTPTSAPTATPAPTPTPRIRVSCADGIRLVRENHKTLFGSMSALDVAFECQPTYSDTGHVLVTWMLDGKQRSATYRVNNQHRVHPVDDNARRIDAIAKYGPLAIRLLRSF